MDTPQIIGFAASVVLIATLASQIWKQWKSGKSEGVSAWLFVGQVIANLGMLTYSILLRDTVFIITTSATFATSCVGLVVQIRQSRAPQRDAPTAADWQRAATSWRQATLSRVVDVEPSTAHSGRRRRTIRMIALDTARQAEIRRLRLVPDAE